MVLVDLASTDFRLSSTTIDLLSIIWPVDWEVVDCGLQFLDIVLESESCGLNSGLVVVKLDEFLEKRGWEGRRIRRRRRYGEQSWSCVTTFVKS